VREPRVEEAMIARLERLAVVLVLLGTACTVLPAVRSPVQVETRRVTILGEEADTLGDTTGQNETGLVAVHTHDARDVWVRESALGGASLVAGNAVLVRSSGAIVTAQVVRALDDFAELELNGASTIVPTSDIVARLHHGTPVAPPPPAVVTPPPPPPPAPTPLARMVALEVAPLSRVAMLDSCSAGVAHVTFSGGAEGHVATSQLHPLRVSAGDHVTALWNESPYPGIILRTRDALVRVRWEDESEQWIDLDDVQSVEAAATGVVHGCAPQRVLVDEGARTRVGRVIACEGSSATILDADGTPRQVERASTRQLPLRVGDAIEARWSGTPYDAIVLTLGERLHVRWYDGSEGDVDPADVVTFRARGDRASEPAACPDA